MKKSLTFVALIVVVGTVWYQWSLRPVDSRSEDRHAVKIESGMSVKQIAQLLGEKGVIRSPRVFTLYAKLHGKESSLQAGKFVLRPSMSVKELIAVLQDGKAEEMLVTIPEGFTIQQIDARLTELGIIEEGEIVRCANECDFSSFEFLPDIDGLAERGGQLEGYLFPDTYYIDVEEFVTKFFLERLLTTFRRRVVETLAADLVEDEHTLHEVITMASLIEEEARADEERPVIAGILWKRYDAGLGLGVDATVRYILDKPTGAITTGDLNTNSPYNTRKFKGLPPGPIASPGEASVIAVLRPEESSYWYYLHGADGEIHYAETNEEHNINKYKYIRGGE